MKVEIDKNILENLLVNCQNFIEKKDLSTITSHILISCANNTFTIKATDFEIGISIYTKEFIQIEEGLATSNGKKILDIIKSLKNNKVILETNEDYLFIRQDTYQSKLPMFNTQEYPNFPTIEGKSKFDIKPKDFLQAIKKITPAIDINNPKYELNGALIDIKEDKINFVGTDTKRLAILTIEENFDDQISLIIPKRAINEIQKLFFEQMQIFYDENIFMIKSENFYFFTKLINGKYPDYERIIPKNINYILKINTEEMIEYIRRISTISYEIKITFKNDAIVFESLNQDNIEAKEELNYESNLPEIIYINANSRYLLDFLTKIDENKFTLGYNDAKLPFLLQSNNFKTIVMPIISNY